MPDSERGEKHGRMEPILRIRLPRCTLMIPLRVAVMEDENPRVAPLEAAVLVAADLDQNTSLLIVIGV